MVTAKVLSPAKINLMLRVVGRRDDGYHLLQTSFQLLDWGDWMTFTGQKGLGQGAVTVTGMSEVLQADNLITRAADALRPHARQLNDWLVAVDKRIPMGAGLGGGSSNAATTLKFLNQQWQCGLEQHELLELATTLGADVPIFVAGHSALATGIGEEITPMSFDTPEVLLLLPDVHINTKALFNHPALQREQVSLAETLLPDPCFWINDFFPLVLQDYPALQRLYERLKTHMPLRLTGTGSTMFAVFSDAAAAEQARRLACEHVRSIRVQPLAA